MFNDSFLNSCLLLDNEEKCATAGHATDDDVIRLMSFACCLDKARDTHSECVETIVFPRQLQLDNLTTILRLYVHFLFYFAFVFAHCAVDLY